MGRSYPGRTRESQSEKGVPWSLAWVVLVKRLADWMTCTYERPHLAGRGCEASDAAEEKHDEEQADHDSRGGQRTGRPVKQLEEA